MLHHSDVEEQTFPSFFFPLFLSVTDLTMIIIIITPHNNCTYMYDPNEITPLCKMNLAAETTGTTANPEDGWDLCSTYLILRYITVAALWCSYIGHCHQICYNWQATAASLALPLLSLEHTKNDEIHFLHQATERQVVSPSSGGTVCCGNFNVKF